MYTVLISGRFDSYPVTNGLFDNRDYAFKHAEKLAAEYWARDYADDWGMDFVSACEDYDAVAFGSDSISLDDGDKSFTVINFIVNNS